MALGLGCSEAHEVFLEHGLNPWPLHWQADSYSLYHQGSPNSCRSFRVIFLKVAVEILFLFINFFLLWNISNITENGRNSVVTYTELGHEILGFSKNFI